MKSQSADLNYFAVLPKSKNQLFLKTHDKTCDLPPSSSVGCHHAGEGAVETVGDMKCNRYWQQWRSLEVCCPTFFVAQPQT